MTKVVNPTRVVNTSERMPHIVRHHSTWWIVGPRDGTQWQKKTIQKQVEKQIHDKHGNIVRTIKRPVAVTGLAQLFELPSGKRASFMKSFPGLVVDEEKIPSGAKPVIVPFKNWCDMPQDAAFLGLKGEYSHVNSETQEADVFHNGGALKRLEEVQEELDRVMGGQDADIAARKTALEQMNAKLEAAEARLRELEIQEAVAKKTLSEAGAKAEALLQKVDAAQKAGKVAGGAADSPEPPQPAETKKRGS